jgi:hypothetical protein
MYFVLYAVPISELSNAENVYLRAFIYVMYYMLLVGHIKEYCQATYSPWAVGCA